MSTLVQQHNPQSFSMSQQRPSNVLSKNLSQHEIQCLYDLLGNDCIVRLKFFLYLNSIDFKFFLDFSNSGCSNFIWM
jgi:hypothetical protein